MIIAEMTFQKSNAKSTRNCYKKIIEVIDKADPLVYKKVQVWKNGHISCKIMFPRLRNEIHTYKSVILLKY